MAAKVFAKVPEKIFVVFHASRKRWRKERERERKMEKRKRERERGRWRKERERESESVCGSEKQYIFPGVLSCLRKRDSRKKFKKPNGKEEELYLLHDKERERESFGQFHQRFMSSFCANILAAKKDKPKL